MSEMAPPIGPGTLGAPCLGTPNACACCPSWRHPTWRCSCRQTGRSRTTTSRHQWPHHRAACDEEADARRTSVSLHTVSGQEALGLKRCRLGAYACWRSCHAKLGVLSKCLRVGYEASSPQALAWTPSSSLQLSLPPSSSQAPSWSLPSLPLTSWPQPSLPVTSSLQSSLSPSSSPALDWRIPFF